MSVDQKATNQTQARYQRIAPLYDRMEVFAERSYQLWPETSAVQQPPELRWPPAQQ